MNIGQGESLLWEVARANGNVCDKRLKFWRNDIRWEVTAAKRLVDASLKVAAPRERF